MNKLVPMAVVLCVFVAGVLCAEERVFFREDFDTLAKWRPITLPMVSRHTVYSIQADGGMRYLRAESNASASGIVHTDLFNAYEFPRARWRWKVDNVYIHADEKTKAGDDHPIRIYIMFFRRSGEESLLERLRSAVEEKLYGVAPPHSSLIYIWSSREDAEEVLRSPFTDRSRKIVLQRGTRNVGTWQEHEVDFIQDYRRTFGADPPPLARIGIMNDSDNTGERSVSYVDFIEVFR